jgi:phosphohistidine phosphatase
MSLLLLVRHAEAWPLSPAGDHERPLTDRGFADAARLGAYFRASGLLPDLVLGSPARRARDTLSAILRELRNEPAKGAPKASLYNADADVLRSTLVQIPQEVKTTLIVGHNPGIGEFARLLVRSGAAPPRHFPAPSLAAIRFSCDWSHAIACGGRLEYFMDFSASSADEHASRVNESL